MFHSLPDGEFFQILKWAFLLFPWKTFLNALVIPSLLVYLILTWADFHSNVWTPHMFFPWVRHCDGGHNICRFGIIFLWTYTLVFTWSFASGFLILMQFGGSVCSVETLSWLGKILFFPFWKEKTFNVLFKVVLHLQIVSLLNSKFQTWSGCSKEGLSPPQIAFHP